jgi:hypothetical protein
MEHTINRIRMMTKRIICVWPDGPKWIVSRDDVQADYGDGNNTGAANSATLDVYDSRGEAVRAAHGQAAETGLPLYIQDEHGIPSELPSGTVQ